MRRMSPGARMPSEPPLLPASPDYYGEFGVFSCALIIIMESFGVLWSAPLIFMESVLKCPPVPCGGTWGSLRDAKALLLLLLLLL